MKFLRDFNFKDKKVLIRVDFNVPLGDDLKVDNSEDWRIEATLPSIKYLLDQGAKIILLAHLGRPNGKIVEGLRLDPVAKRLGELLGRKVIKLDDCCSQKVKDRVSQIKVGEIILLENLRFYPEEKNNDRQFAKQLASYGEIYVNDAFGVDHRAHASLVGIPKYLPSCAGLLLEKEITALTKVLDKPERPLVVIIGGVKISTKIKVIKKFLKKADNVLLGGALANTVLAAKGIAIGQSVVEEGMIEEVKKLELTDIKLHLPVDAITSTDPLGKSDIRIAPIGNTNKEEMILDIGPDTNNLFRQIISQSKAIIWNGPMGLIEVDKFVEGTKKIAQVIANNDSYSVIGGGDSIALIEEMGLFDKMSHVSTGGGAMLKFLAGDKLPGIEALG
ncbi:phosphoglycerate kinase [Patescibacteria group bacterium]|nr:phosphoglycerate kinase [Patescibacteria group bacterium]MBU1563742.1 phosphoglycerate kinase [Patescibacteria group bacterium]MBU2068409.1 phosphoglycerate kinase [Patescibacteria group bacterium]